MDITLGQFCNYTSKFTCGTIWCDLILSNHMCSNCDRGSRCLRRPTGNMFNQPTSVTPEVVGETSSTRKSSEPPLILSDPPHHVVHEPLLSTDKISKADVKIISVYVDVFRQNYGYHLCGRILYENHFQCLWENLTSFPIQSYKLTTVVVGWCFLDILTALMADIAECVCNSERMTFFPIVILRCKKGLVRVKDIYWQLQHRVDLLDIGEQKSLTEDTVATNLWQQLMVHHQDTEEHKYKVFVFVILQGKLCNTVV